MITALKSCRAGGVMMSNCVDCSKTLFSVMSRHYLKVLILYGCMGMQNLIGIFASISLLTSLILLNAERSSQIMYMLQKC